MIPPLFILVICSYINYVEYLRLAHKDTLYVDDNFRINAVRRINLIKCATLNFYAVREIRAP